jgi:predicted metal-dependent hydrolase
MGAMTMSQTSDPQRTVPTRRISFDPALSDLPRHFARDGDLLLSHLAAAMSAVFPDGEDYFVRSVRHFRDQITDPVLKRQVAGFIGQEAMHGREHRALNDRLIELGYPVRPFERMTRWVLALRSRVASPMSNLAATAALEHVTATLAETLLSDERARAEFGHPGLEHLFLWHALEESEHKAVAFDVYQAMGGGERMRIWTMKAVRLGFVIGMVLEIGATILVDPATYRPGNLRASWKRFRRSPIVSASVWGQLREYDRRGFHPNDRDTTALVEEWRTRLFGDAGEISDLLVGTPSAA